jgi:dihydroorotate dehydrogenase (fumarate)
MADLKTSYMGLTLENPVVAGSSGITGSLDGIKRCTDAGVGAVVLKSMFEEVITTDSDVIEEDIGEAQHPEALEYIRAGIGMRLGALPYLDFVEEVRKKAPVPVIASVNCYSPDWWVPYAKRIESAGAHGLELNISHFPHKWHNDSMEIEKRYVEVVQKVTAEISIPVSVKIGFYFTTLWNTMVELVHAGAKALVLFNRYQTVDVDLDNKTVVSSIKLSSPAELHIPLRWIGLAASRLDCDVAATTGVHDSEAVVKALMMGATVTQVCSTLYRNGPSYIENLLDGLSSWMDEENIAGVSELRGLALRNTKEEETVLTRLQYVKALEEASNLYTF